MEKGDGEEPAQGGGVQERSGRRLVKRKKRAARRGLKFPFLSKRSQESLFWVFGKKRKRRSDSNDGSWRVRGREGAEAEMTIQSQDTAEDCTAASGNLGLEVTRTGAVPRAAPECRAGGAASPL